LAGLFLTLSTNTLTGGGSFSFTPAGLSGTPSFLLEGSNDDVNFFTLWASTGSYLSEVQTSQSFASTYASASIFWDMVPQGSIYVWRYLRFVYNAATTGATNIKYIVNGKKSTQP